MADIEHGSDTPTVVINRSLKQTPSPSRQYHFDQNPNYHGSNPTKEEATRYNFPGWVEGFLRRYKGPTAVSLGTASALVASGAMAAENPLTAEAPATANNLASILQAVEIPEEYRNQYEYLDYFKSNAPGTILSESPENIPGFSGFDPRPGPKVAYFDTPGIKNAQNLIMYQGSTGLVRYMKLHTSYFPGGENRIPKIADIQNQYGEPDEPAFVNALDPTYRIMNYGTKGFVIWQPNFGHDGSEAYAYILEEFVPLESPKDYYDLWGRDKVAISGATSGK